jgi:hypothetical protein
MTFTLHAPQIIMACLLLFGFISAPYTHGKTKTQNGFTEVISGIILFLLTYWGGFWSQP